MGRYGLRTMTFDKSCLLRSRRNGGALRRTPDKGTRLACLAISVSLFFTSVYLRPLSTLLRLSASNSVVAQSLNKTCRERISAERRCEAQCYMQDNTGNNRILPKHFGAATKFSETSHWRILPNLVSAPKCLGKTYRLAIARNVRLVALARFHRNHDVMVENPDSSNPLPETVEGLILRKEARTPCAHP